MTTSRLAIRRLVGVLVPLVVCVGVLLLPAAQAGAAGYRYDPPSASRSTPTTLLARLLLNTAGADAWSSRSSATMPAAERRSGAAEGESANSFENPNRNPAQDKPLTPRDIQTLQDSGYDLHGGEKMGGSSSDLYKDGDGNVYEKPKGGAGPGEPIGANLKNLRGK